MKYIFCIIAFCSMSFAVQASDNNPKFPTLKNPSLTNPMLTRVDTLTGQVEYGKAEAKLFEAHSNKSHIDSKIQMLANTQKFTLQAREIDKQNLYNETILDCYNSLSLINSSSITIDRRTLKSVGIALYQVLEGERQEDQLILDQLDRMYKNLENKYCFKKPSKRRIEQERVNLFNLVNQRLLDINESNEIADDISSISNSPVRASAPVQAVALD